MTLSESYRLGSKLVLMLCLAAGPAFSSPNSEPSSDSKADVSNTATPAPDHTDTKAAEFNAMSPAVSPTAIQPADQATPAEIIEQPAPNTPMVESPQIPDLPLAVQIESLKKQLIKLNRDLFILEEELLFPASTQVSVLLAIDADKTFSLDSVKLKIDDEVVTQYLYTQRQIHALQRGGVQRLYMGNLRAGEHEVTAVFIGYGPEQREYKRAATLTFTKETGQKTIELKISASEGSYQPEFSVIES